MSVLKKLYNLFATSINEEYIREVLLIVPESMEPLELAIETRSCIQSINQVISTNNNHSYFQHLTSEIYPALEETVLEFIEKDDWRYRCTAILYLIEFIAQDKNERCVQDNIATISKYVQNIEYSLI